MSKIKYNLTFWQRLELIPMWVMWATTEKDKRKTWHEVKKGMEKHTCDFSIVDYYRGHKFWKCSHEGCNMCEDDDYKNKTGIFKNS